MFRFPVRWATCIVAATVLAAGCGNAPAPAPKEKDWTSLIDEGRAFADLETFAALGGMNHAEGNSDVIRRGRELIKTKLKDAGITQFEHDGFKQRVPDADGNRFREVWMENVVGVIPGKRPEGIAIGCHYDNKIIPGKVFAGANDGASGVALTIELARHFVRRAAESGPPEFTLYFVFFDGEEAFVAWERSFDGVPDNCYGSRRMVASRDRYPIEMLVLLDMVGDKDLQLSFETNSHLAMRDIFSKAGRDFFGIDVFGPVVHILDDHIPFKEAGMTRVIDLIDFHFGPGNSYWHTDADTVDKCAPRSLAKVGSLVLQAYPLLVQWLTRELPPK